MDFETLWKACSEAASRPSTEVESHEVDPEDIPRDACACGWRRSRVPGWGIWHSTFKRWKPDAVCGPVEA